MKLQIVTLCENTVGSGDVLAEDGLSVIVKTDDATIMFDAGRSISARYNADILGFNLYKIDKIVLSHGHFDHTGGLRSVLPKMRKEVDVIAHPDIWLPKYFRSNKMIKYAGIPFQREELENLGAKFNLTAKPVKITDTIMTTGEIPLKTDFEDIDPNLLVKGTIGMHSDSVLDDQALVISTPKGLVVVLGCAHRGIINTLYCAQQLTGIKQIYTVLGGAHLFRASSKRIKLTIASLKDLGVQKLGLCHCTGLYAITEMAQAFGNRFFFNSAGNSINLL